MRAVAIVAAVLAGTVGFVPGSARAHGAYYELERIATARRIVALTFDGGDNAGGAPAILAALRRGRVPATFFLTGRWARRYPRLVRAIAARYPVGNHTYDHAALTPLSDAAVTREVVDGARWLRAETGHDPRPLFRFPYGDRDARTVAIVNRLGYVSVRWSLDTWGWMGPSEGQSIATVLRRVTSQLRPGAVILMHLGVARDGSLLDARALPAVIRAIERRGYKLVALTKYVHAPR